MITTRVADRVFDELRRRIVVGELAPGDRIDPTELADSLGVSRTPVREALLKLDAEGLVERQPYRGVVASGIDHAAAEDITAMRIQLEVLAVRAAVPRLQATDLEQLRRAHASFQAAVQGQDADRSFGDLNREFHLTLYRLAGSERLVRLIRDLSVQAERIRAHFNVRGGPAVQEHEAILHACEAGDVEAAARATQRHILAVLFRVMRAGYVVPEESALDVALRSSGVDVSVLDRSPGDQ
ncbi:GntR family transcriptional regulator [Micromonospora globispora]|uniref:GntR family transcriptional regulator n=1 Tax=Micromonospora globispora TaxID=1450148 RepID=UPI000D70495B|nr:GntR family transcriptional regulator [Micromonospora globispora]PWU55492.1 GntR family transcriptional regulator [Micromonospora globispora]RQW98020.1 GntR family transcriptional regulator [Micromonospora globispora]